MFTVEVEKKSKDEKFTVGGIGLSHKECFGGKVNIRVEDTDGLSSVIPLHWEMRVRCERCLSCIKLSDSLIQEINPAIVQTAITGEKKSFKDKKGGELIFIQKP